MKKEFVKNPYNYDSDELSEETGLQCKDESLTEQEHVQEADINYIAERFMRTGEMKQVLHPPTPGDFDGIFDFQSAMNVITEAKREFMSMPAKLRTRFNNDPGELLDFLNDEENRPEAEKLGLVEKRDIIATPTTGEPNDTGTQRSTRQPPQSNKGADRAQSPETKDAGTQKS